MGLKNIANIKSGYDSGFDNILHEFYIPVLRETYVYRRIAGFFSSTSLSIAARGIAGLVKNGGYMEMIVSPRLSEEDIEMIEMANQSPEDIISRIMIQELSNFETLLQKKRVDTLGWLLANGLLRIKVATVFDSKGRLLSADQIDESGLFHIKVGILEDIEGNIITFSGSINETASAWVRNIEEFKVFKSWEVGQRESVKIDIDKFDMYWNGKSNRVVISDLPTAVSKKIIEHAPKSFDEIEADIAEQEIEETKNNKLTFIPFDYQIEALNVWKRKHCAIFEMATGTGKTKTAEICIFDFLREQTVPRVVFVICPQDTLAKQWLDDIENSGLEWENYLIADSASRGWKEKLVLKLLDINVDRAGKNNILFVYSTFDTYSSEDFITIVSKYKMNAIYFLIGDEVHGLGAPQRIKGLLEIYDYRLGLSATPERWFDEYGTKKVIDYFGEDRFVFSLHQALTTINPLSGKTYLTPYMYIPRFVSLTDEETIRYNQLTKQIVQNINRSHKDNVDEEKIEKLVFLRADQHKSANNKYIALERILDELGSGIKNTIIFVSPGQIEDVLNILAQRKIVAHPFTSEQGKFPQEKYGNKSEREHIIKMFKEGDYQALVAMKCLDEGIDIPSANMAIIMASSTNPREYIQRIGRIIRRSEGKELAVLYDIIVEPNYERLDPELARQERNIFKKEMVRIKEISEEAVNRVQIIDAIYERLL